MKSRLFGLLKEFSFRTGLLRKRFFSVYPYMFTPAQLSFIGETCRSVKHVSGLCLEVGVAYGATTVFLRKLMEEDGIAKDYVAIDTFAGFLPEHVAFEVDQRSKRPGIQSVFVRNKRKWFETTLATDGVGGVRAIAADAARFDYATLGPVSFCLLDVDLYIPVRDALPGILRQLAPGGIIVIDDCSPGGDWDGALQAYQEFCTATGLPVDIRCGKLGIIRKPA